MQDEKIILNFIDGRYEKPIKGNYLDIFQPATGAVYGKVAASDHDDVAKAVEAAKKALPIWSAMPIAKRSNILMNLALLIEQNLEELAYLEANDTGKPIFLTKTVDIPRAAANFRFFASAIVNHATQAHIMENEAVNYTRKAPIGIVGCISPWNLPLYLFTWKIAPALAMGNCVIGKPSELTPVTAAYLGNLTKQAGMPDGVLAILHGRGQEVGEAIVKYPDIKAISFTGGTATGRHINQIAAGDFKKVSLELGGKNPILIFEDADIKKAVSETVRAAFSNQGQICLCGSRILIHASIYDRFKKEFLTEVSTLTIGNPLNESVRFGALISAAHRDKVLGFIHDAENEGGQLLTGGKSIQPDGLNGYFVAPTVIENTPMNCKINQEEVFGPVVTLTPFDDESEAIRLANASKYGLASTIWTKDVARAHRVSHQIQAGIIWVNCWMLRDLRTPFGGMKASGVGREGGDEAMRFFTETQNICIHLG